MENKPAQNIQDTFLNTVRKDKTPITIYLVSGVKLTGKIRSFDKYSVLLENNSQEQLIFKHAISTVVSNRSVLHTEHRPAWRVNRAWPGSCRRAGSVSGDCGAAIAGGERSRLAVEQRRHGRRAAGGQTGPGTSRSARSWWEWTSGPLSGKRAPAWRARAQAARRPESWRRKRPRRGQRLRPSEQRPSCPDWTPKSLWPSFASWWRAPAARWPPSCCSAVRGPIRPRWSAPARWRRLPALPPPPQADLVLFDHDLSPTQLRNLEAALPLPRSGPHPADPGHLCPPRPHPRGPVAGGAGAA